MKYGEVWKDDDGEIVMLVGKRCDSTLWETVHFQWDPSLIEPRIVDETWERVDDPA